MKHVFRASAFVLLMGAACSQKTVGLNISVPSALSANAVWYEIGAFKGAQCGALLPLLPGGIPEGFTSRYAFKKDDANVPDFGDLPNAKYAFGAVARDTNCAIIATGCSDIDAGDADNVSISLAGVDPPQGACPTGSTCEAARCVPANNNADPSVGANCSLELLGAGPLANSAGVADTLISAPAIAATKNGFMIVYREIDGAGGSGGGARLVILPIDNSGGALRPQRPGLPNRCSSGVGGDVEDDGVGLLISGNNGMATLAKAPCPSADNPAAALELFTFQVESAEDPLKPGIGKLFDSPSPNADTVRLGPARPAGARASGSLVVFTEAGVARIANMDPAKGIVGPNGSFGGPRVTNAWISASDKVLALLAVGPGDPTVQPIDDAGTEDAGAVVGPSSETKLRLLMLPATTDIQTVATTTTRLIAFDGVWGSVASTGGRVIVASDGSGPGRSVSYRAFDLGKEEPADSSGFGIENTTLDQNLKTTAGDVTILGDRAFIAGLQLGQVGLQVFNNATTQLTPLRTVSFARETRISGISTVRDGSVAVAASPTRVAVVWTTAKKLLANDAAGGYAVFACTQ